MGRKLRAQSGILGVLLALACTTILLRQVDLKQSWGALGRLNGIYLGLSLLVFLFNLPLRAWRWQLIFRSSARPRFLSCLTVLGIGNMANFLLPARAGDITRSLLLAPSPSVADTSRTLATLAVEKVLDGLALAAMVLFAFWISSPPHWVAQLLYIAVLLFGGTLILLVVLRQRTRGFVEVVQRVFRRFPLPVLEDKLIRALTSFADGLSVISSSGQMLVLLTITAVIWASEAMLIFVLARALAISLPLESAAVASAILGLGFMIPAAPGGLGTYELFGTEAFRLFEISSSSALALTLVIHAWVFVVNVGAGMILLAIRGLSLSQLRGEVRKSPDTTATAAATSIRGSL